jgi:hypothetical protein
MRVHGNRIDANYPLNPLYGAAKVDAKDAAERVRRRLMSAAALAGDLDEAADCVVRLSGDGAQRDEANQQDAQQQEQQNTEPQAESKKIEDSFDPFSDWA